MNMNSNIKCGTSINGGMVLTDMPIDALKAMRNSIDDAIRKYQEREKDKYITDIQGAIDAARDAGYNVYINGDICDDEADIELDDDDDDEDNNDWCECDYDNDDPCYGCREDCLHCRHC